MPALATGCSFLPGTYADTSDDAGVVINDADRVFLDARPDAPPDSVCFGGGLYFVCYPLGQEPTGTYQPANNTTVDTDVDANCDRVAPQNNGPELCVKTAATISIAGDVRFEGTRPIVLVATQSITVGGEIDVSDGAGANTGTCMGPGDGRQNLGNGPNNGGSGAGGGGFGSPGGAGGNGVDRQGGAAGQAVPAAYIRGGCAGGRGGASSVGQGGRGGHSGGGVYLVAGESITIAGEIRANGMGGLGGPNKAGGGGGGSGGLIGLDAPTVTVTGVLVANGGGGGEGGGDGKRGSDGEDADDWNEIPDGGEGNTGGGNGGDGAYRTTTAKAGGDVGKGGGGGGGGLGRILVRATNSALSATISPTPVVTTLP